MVQRLIKIYIENYWQLKAIIDLRNNTTRKSIIFNITINNNNLNIYLNTKLREELRQTKAKINQILLFFIRHKNVYNITYQIVRCFLLIELDRMCYRKINNNPINLQKFIAFCFYYSYNAMQNVFHQLIDTEY